MQYVDGDWHYYDESGNPATGWYTWEDGARSYFEDGVAATDWTHIDGKTYYFVQDGEHGCLIWERRIDDKVYYFDGFGVMHTGWLTWKKDATRSYFGADGAALSGWQTVGGKRYYFDPANWCHGYRWEHRIGGKVYYFDADCHMWTGWLTWKKDQTRSYFGADGAALSRWQTVGGKRYYFDPANWNHGYRWEHWVGDDFYYFDADCSMYTGWLTWNRDKTRSYFGSDGTALSGWRNDGGKRHYIDPKTFRTVRWEHRIDGKVYYFDGFGVMHTGWLTWKKDSTRSYFGADGAALSGWQTVGGKRYYFDPANWCHGYRWEHRVGGKVYYFDSDCHMWTGWLTWKKDSTRSYFGADGAALSGWQTVGGKRHYIDPKTFRTVRWEHRIGGKVYYFDADCCMWTGWLTWKKDSTRSYFGADGAALSGWQTVGGRRYYFDPANWCHGYRWEHKIDGKVYYFDADCHMWTGWLTWKKDKSRSYFGADGAAVSGWKSDGSKRYYIDPKTYHTVRWEHWIGDKEYYFDGDYSLVTRSWIQFKYDNCPTWADSEGLLTKVPGASLDSAGMLKGARPGWLFLGSDRFYIKSDGTPCTEWMTSGASRYWFMKNTGAAAEGILEIGDSYYSFSPTTQAMETGWKTVGSHTYYFDPQTGKAVTSSRKIDGKIHYFDVGGWEITALQYKVLQAARGTPSPGGGLCAMWISQVFQRAGIAKFGGDARDQYRWYCHSSDRDQLHAGMIVAVSRHNNTYLGRIYGHVCLYVGGGKIMDNIGRIRTMDLQSWLDYYDNLVTPKWGWAGHVALA